MVHVCGLPSSLARVPRPLLVSSFCYSVPQEPLLPPRLPPSLMGNSIPFANDPNYAVVLGRGDCLYCDCSPLNFPTTPPERVVRSGRISTAEYSDHVASINKIIREKLLNPLLLFILQLLVGGSVFGGFILMSGRGSQVSAGRRVAGAILLVLGFVLLAFVIYKELRGRCNMPDEINRTFQPRFAELGIGFTFCYTYNYWGTSNRTTYYLLFALPAPGSNVVVMNAGGSGAPTVVTMPSAQPDPVSVPVSVGVPVAEAPDAGEGGEAASEGAPLLGAKD